MWWFHQRWLGPSATSQLATEEKFILCFTNFHHRPFKKNVLIWFPHILKYQRSEFKKGTKETRATQNLQSRWGEFKSHFQNQVFFLKGTITKRSLTTGVYVSQVSILALCRDSSLVEILPTLSLPSTQECSRKIRIMSFPCPTWEPYLFCHLDDPNYSKFQWNIKLVPSSGPWAIHDYDGDETSIIPLLRATQSFSRWFGVRFWPMRMWPTHESTSLGSWCCKAPRVGQRWTLKESFELISHESIEIHVIRPCRNKALHLSEAIQNWCSALLIHYIFI